VNKTYIGFKYSK